MAKSFEKMSLSELEEAIAAKRNELESRRSELMEELSSIDSVLDTMGGTTGASSVAAPAKKRPGRPKGSVSSAKKTTGRRGPRAKNAMSMKDAISKALEGKKNGLTLDEIADAVKALGYKSNSGNFKNVVYQSLYGNKEQFPKNDAGKYTAAN